MKTSIVSAACEALACYLRGALVSDIPGLVVEPRWVPETSQLPERMITIIKSGTRTAEFLDPIPISSEATSVATQRVYTWRISDILQPLQLDVWATSEAHRDDIVARLEGPLNRGLSIVDPTADPFGPGLTLALGCGWTGYGDFVFTDLEDDDTADAVQRSEYRAMARGRVRATMTVKLTEPRLSRVFVAALINGSLPRETIATIEFLNP